VAKEYIALIRKESDSDFGVSFPDLPGCVTAGRTLDEALAAAREALALHLEGLAEDGAAIPEPSTLEAVMAKRAHRDAVAALVPAPVIKARAVRVNVTLPEDLLDAIDSTAGPGGRSGFLAEAAQYKLGPKNIAKRAKTQRRRMKRAG
jgi:predicted RNase H-like HicB family nuclease